MAFSSTHAFWREVAEVLSMPNCLAAVALYWLCRFFEDCDGNFEACQARLSSTGSDVRRATVVVMELCGRDFGCSSYLPLQVNSGIRYPVLSPVNQKYAGLYDESETIFAVTTERKSPSQLILQSISASEDTKNLIPQAPVPPRLYRLPKVHKEGVPLRPIVSAIGSPTYNLARHLTSLLSPFVGWCDHHVKNSTDFVKTLKTIRIEEQDILGKFYKQKEGVPMGSPLSPAIANLFMEDFEERALESAPLHRKHFFGYVDDAFIVWPHGSESLTDFLAHMNSVHPNIKFTTETEKDNRLPFLDILIEQRADGSRGHSMYRKPTHKDLYLNGRSHHHPAQKNGVLRTLIHRAKAVSDAEHLKSEIDHLRTTFRSNGFTEGDIKMTLKKSLRKKAEADKPDVKPTGRACLPYVSTISNKISRILRRHNVETIHKPLGKLKALLGTTKDKFGLKTSGVYRIPCECGQVYIGETGRTIEKRLKEHERCIRLYYPNKSAVAEHSLENGHRINFQDTKLICQAKNYWDRVLKESVEIR
ncbi:uncharacterized protein LOC124159465 [Ischnura elegans]|uniref:uncharacterized protein LOC124159465 n=1 Tax=Ischnura elegans TaxID=197161 RepID=UPI001ED86CAD|nr:uncharacterized protein LOC124159465 [Ischnura elegans]